jgi:hypothetical protein
MLSSDNKIIQKKKLHPPHSRSSKSSESQRASSDQKQSSESNKRKKAEIDKELEYSEALLFQCNLAHSLEERRTTPALFKTLDQGSNKLITSKEVDYSKGSLLSRFVRDRNFDLYLPGDKELVKVLKKSIEKYFIEYRIGSYTSYRDLCIKRDKKPVPYPPDSFDGYATPNRGPWSSAQSLWIPEDHLKQILPNQPLDWLCYGWEKCITLGTEGYNHKLPLLTVATPWKEVSRKLTEIKQYPMGKAAKKREKAARAISASEALYSEEKLREEKVDLPSLSQTHNESEISSIEGEETVLGDDTGDVDENPLFTAEEEEAMSKEPTAEERLPAEWMFSRITSMKCNVGRKDG